MDDSQVLIKIAADVGDAVAAMQAMVAQVAAMIAAFTEVGDKAKESGKDVDDFHKQSQKSSEESVASGILLSKAWDLVVESIDSAIKAIPGMIDASAEMGDQFQAMSNRLGVSVNSLSELSFIAQQSGANMQGLARTIQGVGGILGDEFGKQAMAIKKLGINFDELKQQTPEEAFYTIIKAIKDVVPATQQNSVAMEILGSKFRSNTMLLNEDTDELRRRFEAMGGGVSDALGKLGNKYESIFGEIHLKQQSFKNSVAENVLPSVNAILKSFTELPGPMLVAGEAVVDVGEKFLKYSENIIMSKGWEEYASQMVKAKDKILDYSGRILDSGKAVLTTVQNWASEALKVNWTDVFKSGKGAVEEFGGSLKDFGIKLIEMPEKVLQNLPSLSELSTMLRTNVMSAFTAVRGAMTAMLGPWGLVAIAVVALGAALYQLVGGWDGIKTAMAGAVKFFEDLWVIIKHLTVDGIQALVKWFSDLRESFKSTGEGTGILATAVKAISFIFEKWVGLIKTLTSWIPGLFKMLGKAVGDTADKYRELDEAKSKAEDPEKTKKALEAPLTGMALLAKSAEDVAKAYTKLKGANEEQVKAALAGGASTAEVGKALAEQYHESADVWTKAVEKFKKDQEEVKKAADATPLAKLTKDATELAKSLVDASRAQMPLSAQMEEFGKKAADVVDRAAAIPGEFAKLPPAIRDMGTAWNEQQLAEKMASLDGKIRDIGEAFKTKTEAGAKAAGDAVKAMTDSMAQDYMSASDKALAAITTEEEAKLTSITAQQDALTHEQDVEAQKVREAFDAKRREATKFATDGKGLSAERKQQIDDEEAAALDAAASTTRGTMNALNKQRDAIVAFYANKRAIEAKDTGDLEKDLQLLGYTSQKVADETVAIEKAKLQRLRDLNDPYFAEEIRQQEAKVRAVEAAASATEKLLKGLGVTSKAVNDQQIADERAKLAALQALDDPYYAAEIQASQDRIAKLELETSEFEKAAKARGLATKADAELRVATETETLQFMKDNWWEFTDQAIAAQEAVVRAAKKAAGDTSQTWGEALGTMSKSFGDLSKTVGGGFGSMLSGVGSTMGNLQAAQKQADEGGGQFGGLSTLMNAKGTMAKASAAVAMAANVAEGAQKVWAATDKRTAGQRAMGGAMAGAEAGAAFGPWGMAIGAAAGLVTGLIRGKPDWAKATDEISRDFGVQVSDELGKAIAKDAKDKYGGDRLTATVSHIGDIIKEAGGVTDDNATKLTARLRDTFSLVETGKLKADEGRKILDDNFGAFADHILKSGQVASNEFTEIIKLNQTSGLKSAEVINFVAGQTERLGTSLTSLMAPQAKQLADYQTQAGAVIDKLSGLKEGTAEYAAAQAELTKLNEGAQATFEKSGESMGRFERLAVAGFNSAVAAGVPFIDALDQMGPSFDSIIAQNQTLGREGGAAINELLRFREVASANKEVVESAGALNEVMLALSNTGALNVDTMADLQAQGGETFQQLQDAGFTEAQSLQQMKGYLEQVRTAHEDLGLPIDENTQKMLDQAEANGVLSKKQMSTNDIMIQGLGAIIEAVGGKLPAAFKTMADGASDAAQVVGKAIGKDATKTVTDLSDKVEKVPFDGLANESLIAAKQIQDNMASTQKAVGTVQSQLDKTDWGGWAKKGVDAAYSAKDAVDALSYGHSPGGIKDIPILLDQSAQAASEFARKASLDLLRVKDTVDSMPAPDLVGQMSENAAQAAQAAQKMMLTQQRESQAQQAEQAASNVNLSFDITAFDAQGVQQAVEQQILPQMLDTLRRGRQLTAMRELMR